MAVFASRQIVMPVVPPSTIAVTITGSGHQGRCYAIINKTKQDSAGTHEVYAGDTITFGVYGDGDHEGYVEIDGTRLLTVVNGSVKTRTWTVPSGISTIGIAMRYSSSAWYGRITVTTS